MSKFKIGDRVKIVNSIGFWETEEETREAQGEVGLVGKIKVDMDGNYTIDGSKYGRTGEELELLKSTNPIEMVNHPQHYNQGKYEAIDVIEDWKLNFNLGSAIKYIARCDYKDNKKEDLEKASWYIDRELQRL